MGAATALIKGMKEETNYDKLFGTQSACASMQSVSDKS
jgi:hypothetical protein